MPDTRLLIFGGTFDPPHVAHTTLPPLVAQRLECPRILYVPAVINPLKTDQPNASPEQRLAMLGLALDNVVGAEIDTIELDRPPPSYTVDTLEALRRRLGPRTTLLLLIGSDQALAFHEWKDWPRILELATPSVMVRPPFDEATYQTRLGEIYSVEEAGRWMGWSVAVPPMDICANELRRRLASGGDVDGLIQPAVIAYIRRHGLYGSTAAGSAS